jgi:hypothetical protein
MLESKIKYGSIINTNISQILNLAKALGMVAGEFFNFDFNTKRFLVTHIDYFSICI